MKRRHFLEVLAEAQWQLHAQERGWEELSDLEQEQLRMEAQHCVEALTSAGWAIIGRSTREEARKLRRARSPHFVVGWGPFRLPGERRVWARAEVRAREMLDSIKKAEAKGKEEEG